jgi:hypothetical protein
MRNKLFHQGIHESTSEEQSLLAAVTALRELLVRIFFAVLDYHGPYMSYLNGPSHAHFSRQPAAASAAAASGK